MVANLSLISHAPLYLEDKQSADEGVLPKALSDITETVICAGKKCTQFIGTLEQLRSFNYTMDDRLIAYPENIFYFHITVEGVEMKLYITEEKGNYFISLNEGKKEKVCSNDDKAMYDHIKNIIESSPFSDPQNGEENT